VAPSAASAEQGKMKCKDLERVVEQDGLDPLPEAARVHLAECGACRNLLGDFAAIANTAREFPAEADPPERLWVSLRTQLVTERIIREPRGRERSSGWESVAAFLRSRTLATAAAGLALVVAAALELYQIPAPPMSVPPAYAETAAMLSTQEKRVSHSAPAGTTPSPVDASLRDNLEIVNKFIADCELRVRQEPGDEIARDYLSGAYQQKADVLSAMMERNGNGD
jgi:hypothetical protein